MTISPILYQNQVNKFPDIYSDYQQIKSATTRADKDDSSTEAMPILNRLNSFADKMASREYTTALGIGTLAVMNGPEELSDVVSAYKQIKGNYKRPYNNKEAQHPFSFFRGTIFNDYVNPNSPKCMNRKVAKWLLDKDMTLWDTSIGKLVSKIFKINMKEIQTDIPDIRHTETNPNYVFAKQFNTSSKFGELTARALTRTPILSVAALGGIEATHITHAVNEGADIFNAIGKSALTLGSTLVSGGYLGAIGAKYAGPCGSLIGTGLGSVIGYKVSKALD